MTSRGVFSVVVAEDEQIILDNIIEKIELTDLNFKVISSAMDGEDALLLIKQFKPDVLFTDIHMPSMDGLELIQQAKKIKPELEVVIISGYNDFSYAQQAIRLGVTDYILKPIKKELLLQTITSIKSRLEMKASKLANDTIENIIYGIKPMEARPAYLKNVHFQVHLICLGNLYTNTADVLDTDYFERLWSMVDWSKIATANSWDESVPRWIINDKLFNQRFLIIAGSEHACDPAVLRDVISTSLLESIPITICTEETLVSLEDIGNTTRSMRVALVQGLLCCRSSLITMKDRKSTDRPYHNYDSVHMNSIKTLVKQKQFDSLPSELLHLFAQWENSSITQRQLEKLLVKLAAELLILLGCEDDNVLASIEKELYEIVAISNHFNSLFSDVLQLFNNSMYTYIYPRKKGIDTSEELYNKLKVYIRTNMSEPITISTLVEKFNFNSSYIIRVFKKYSGEPPMKFLTSLRIHEAKRLIERQAELDFKDISKIIGYSEQQYFSRVFKNTTGMSPSEYKESITKSGLSQG
ncbi:response regulator [Paenibacillus sp. FSL K6-0276]|uniref:response regulator n=1 Tax=unclassified Paenibacillus TaxID=185978 RepID=UPI0028A69948|nr:response regulator [Paenibacillus sp.]